MAADREAVLAALDKLLADRPHRVSHDFAAATEALTAYRDVVVHRFRADDAANGRATLDRLNAVLSVLVGTHYPLGAPKWEELQKARDAFAALRPELPV